MEDLLTPAEMARADQLAGEAGVSSFTLMQRAGEAVAQAAAQLASRAGILILCGPGNNGGDGLVAAQILRERGHSVRVALLGPAEALCGDAGRAAKEWGGPIDDAQSVSFEPADLIVDALFGAGLARDLTGAALDLVSRLGTVKTPVLAVDLPSGIDGASGQVRGVAVKAQWTVTFVRRKPGHLLLPGRTHCGVVEVADIGMPPEVIASIRSEIAVNAPSAWQAALPRLEAGTHKYRRGHAVVVSGGIESSGAARMAARACLRIGAGLVTVACPSDALSVQAAALEAVMVRKADGVEGLASLLADTRKNAVLLGPGLGVGAETRERVLGALDGERHVVLDADALTSFADDADSLFMAIQAGRGAVVLTPHEGEFLRLFPDFGVPASKLDRARQAASRSGAVLIYKGADSTVAAPDGRATIAENAPPFLATAGAGDVLAGMVTGLMAQAMPAFEAASAAVWLHGEAALKFGPGLVAEDIELTLPRVLTALQAGFLSDAGL